MYREWGIPELGVLWRSSAGGAPTVIPADGSADVILRDDELIIAGPSTRALTGHGSVHGDTVGLRFAPGAAGLALRTNPAPLRDQQLCASEVVPKPVAHRAAALLRRLRDADLMQPGRPEALATFQDFVPLIRASADSGFARAAAPWTIEVRHLASSGAPKYAAAQHLGYSERQLQRRMLDHFGYGYTALRRVLRAERSQQFLRSHLSPIAAARLAGYSDQSHLTREFRVLVGTTPTQFAAAASAAAGRAAYTSMELPSGSSTVE
ncbi:helix-turn-helix protein [Leucobacter luti]|uniref:helix-turn-helix transcriptional regulator n=1 Tax=Leucobacter luti TaxID=340320 RepID=UPI00104FDCA8|nr:helix-turn-helix transcriptional regulator [Leucobacter luti]MCW2287780.1 AraC-like DNA-binding protein [Leucobacter luti]TCK46057.1 helix-turn-helix protein [Leucobacter luti]